MTRDIGSNIPLRLQDFSQVSPLGAPPGKEEYLTLNPSSCHNTDTEPPLRAVHVVIKTIHTITPDFLKLNLFARPTFLSESIAQTK